MFMCLCYVLCLRHQGDSAHLCCSDRDKGGRSTLVLNFKSELKKEFQWRVLKN